MFITELVLAIPDPDKKIRVEVDTLDYAIEEVLSVKCRDKNSNLLFGSIKTLPEKRKSKV